jgi:uncharacterized protein with von Willebrand factor type A (vWA) domain
MATDHEPLARLVEFGGALRAEGVPVGSGQVVSYCEGVTLLDPADIEDLYWAGRACLLSGSSDIPAYDRVFAAFFRQAGASLRATVAPGTVVPAVVPSAVPTVAARPTRRAGERAAGTGASSLEALRHKPFSECTPEELAALRALMARLELDPPRRRGRRTEPYRHGPRPDLRRTLRRSLRAGGELAEPAWRRRRLRPRRIVLLLDVSGSMADYSRALLQFAYSAARGGRLVEAFCFATRLTRVTGALHRPDPDAALGRASEEVLDWDGGTRIGESLREFRRSWGQRGLARGGVVVICSDGLERGEPEVLADEMRRLRRLSHRIVWVNPLKGDPSYEPLARGMRAALPHVDVFLAGHDLSSLETLSGLLPALR